MRDATFDNELDSKVCKHEWQFYGCAVAMAVAIFYWEFLGRRMISRTKIWGIFSGFHAIWWVKWRILAKVGARGTLLKNFGAQKSKCSITNGGQNRNNPQRNCETIIWVQLMKPLDHLLKTFPCSLWRHSCSSYLGW